MKNQKKVFKKSFQVLIFLGISQFFAVFPAQGQIKMKSNGNIGLNTTNPGAEIELNISGLNDDLWIRTRQKTNHPYGTSWTTRFWKTGLYKAFED